MEITICSNCLGDIYRNNVRYSIDVMIVPIAEESFEEVKKERKYIIPTSYLTKGGKKKSPKLLAFYRVGKIGAITDVAVVKDIKFGVNIAELYSLIEKGVDKKWSREPSFVLFELETLMPLKEMIARNGSFPIQNRCFKKFKQFVLAKELKDLYESKKQA
jgi:hypothetical protein